jgi:hypothetical protein
MAGHDDLCAFKFQNNPSLDLRSPIVSTLSEKSLLFVMALTLGLIITWLISTDPANTTQQTYNTSAVNSTQVS